MQYLKSSKYTVIAPRLANILANLSAVTVNKTQFSILTWCKSKEASQTKYEEEMKNILKASFLTIGYVVMSVLTGIKNDSPIVLVFIGSLIFFEVRALHDKLERLPKN